MTEGAAMYHALREAALSTPQNALKLDEGTNALPVYGVAMDGKVAPDRWFTLVAFANGEASLYFSTGGGIIGGGRYEPVRAAASAFVSTAALFPERDLIAGTAALPVREDLQFHLLTGDGPQHICESTERAEKEGSPLNPLLLKAHELIAEIRLNAEN